MNIGFVGLGIMGAPMAGHLLAAGHRVQAVLKRRPAPSELTKRGLQVVPSLSELARANEAVITMLPDTPDVEQVLLGETGVISGIQPNSLVIDMSSISPVATAAIAAEFRDKQCAFVDAPVSGGEIGAKAASLTIMVGGDPAAFSRALPLLKCMGTLVTHIGERSGAGQICKLANQIIVALSLEAVAEALVFVSKAGCDPATVRQALMSGLAASRVLEVHGERMIQGHFAPGFRIRLHHKDLRLALETARMLGVPLPNTEQGQQLLIDCIANEEGDQDHSALIHAIERMSHHSIRPK